MTHELVTLQFGNYSNYIGAHYWNIQENQFNYENELNKRETPDVNHDVLFREGIDKQNRLSFTPRMLLFDLKENINLIKAVNPLENSRKFNNWDGNIQVFESKKRPISQYVLDLEKKEEEDLENENRSAKNERRLNIKGLKDSYEMDEQVKYWSDYMKVKYNERSFTLLNYHQSSIADSESDVFNLYNHGLDVAQEATFSESLEDNLRHYAEECNLIQGFQLFVDSYNGFGALAANALSFINEEFPKSPAFAFLSFPCYDPQEIESNSFKLINTSLTLKNLLNQKEDLVVLPLSLFSSFYTEKELKPVNLFSVDYKPKLNYHTSAILASLIDNVTLPWRQKSHTTLMSDVVELLDVYKCKIANLSSIYPLRLETKNYLFNYLEENDLLNVAQSFSPLCSNDLNTQPGGDASATCGSLNLVCRGVENPQVKNVRDNYYFKDIVAAHSVLDRYLVDMYPKSKSKSYSIQTALDVSLPFPNIFKDETAELMIKKRAMDPKEISLITILQMNKTIYKWLKFMENCVEKTSKPRQAKYFENGMEYDDFGDLKSFNNDLCDMYLN